MRPWLQSALIIIIIIIIKGDLCDQTNPQLVSPEIALDQSNRSWAAPRGEMSTQGGGEGPRTISSAEVLAHMQN